MDYRTAGNRAPQRDTLEALALCDPGSNEFRRVDWYAIRVKANREHVTKLSLAGRGYETFLPLYSAIHSEASRPKPLFPGYVFSRFDSRQRLPVVTSPGVVSIVGFGGTLAPLDEAEVAAIRSMVMSKAPLYPWPFLKEGQRVRVVKGALAGLEGIVSRSPRGWRVVASITLLQRSVAVEIERSRIEPI